MSSVSAAQCETEMVVAPRSGVMPGPEHETANHHSEVRVTGLRSPRGVSSLGREETNSASQYLDNWPPPVFPFADPTNWGKKYLGGNCF